MPRTCSVCSHPERDSINLEIVSGEPNRRVATRFGVSESSIRRHKDAHIPKSLVEAAQAGEIAAADDLAGRVEALQSRTERLLNTVERLEDYKLCRDYIREVRENLKLIDALTQSRERSERLDRIEEQVGEDRWVR